MRREICTLGDTHADARGGALHDKDSDFRGIELLRWATIILVAGSLAACQNDSAKAEAELDMMQNVQASGNERCAAEQKVAQAYLHEGNQPKFDEWRKRAASTCMVADFNPDWARSGRVEDLGSRGPEEIFGNNSSD